jgi:hypothetical protein
MPSYVAVVTVRTDLHPDELAGMADALGARETWADVGRAVLSVPGEAPDLPTATQAARQHAAEVLDGYPHDVEVQEDPGP